MIIIDLSRSMKKTPEALELRCFVLPESEIFRGYGNTNISGIGIPRYRMKQYYIAIHGKRS
jgi:hypothetical protein